MLLDFGARKSRRELNFAGEKLHRQIRVQLRIHQLERATFGDRRQSSAKARHDWFALAGMEHQLVAQPSGQRFDECETARVSGIRLGDERAGDVCDLRFHNAIASPQLHRLRVGLGGDHVFLNTPFAVILGLTYGYLPFMILPLYASIERMDTSLVEASYDLGHAKTSTLFRVIIPSVSPGLVAGVLLVFIPAVGDFITPTLLGGVRTQMIGTTIADQYGDGANWPLGSAL